MNRDDLVILLLVIAMILGGISSIRDRGDINNLQEQINDIKSERSANIRGDSQDWRPKTTFLFHDRDNNKC
jgi:hypothetical protein